MTALGSLRALGRFCGVLAAVKKFEKLNPLDVDGFLSGLLGFSFSLVDEDELNEFFSTSLSDGFRADFDLLSPTGTSLSFFGGDCIAESSLAFDSLAFESFFGAVPQNPQDDSSLTTRGLSFFAGFEAADVDGSAGGGGGGGESFTAGDGMGGISGTDGGSSFFSIF